MNPIEVRLERAGSVESVHVVHAVLAGPTAVERAWGEAGLPAFWRSSMKPFQALPLVRDGVFERSGLGNRELAVACASHHGMPEHVEAAGRILEAAAAEESDLACGAHRPIDPGAAEALDGAGRRPGRLHNNCSGKHAAMIAAARAYDRDIDGYHTFGHPVQRRIREELSAWIDEVPGEEDWGVDGCGVPTARLPLSEMARAYARFGASGDAAVATVASAMTAHPNMVSGPTALSAAIMRETEGRLLAKEGAEGVFCVSRPGDGRGAAFKVRDGAMRALGPAVMAVLRTAGELSAAEAERLSEFEVVTIRNTRDEAVATLRAVTA